MHKIWDLNNRVGGGPLAEMEKTKQTRYLLCAKFKKSTQAENSKRGGYTSGEF